MHNTENSTEATPVEPSTTSSTPSVSTPTPAPSRDSNQGPQECAGCGKRITERYLLKALELAWHEDCLKCGCCDCRLGEVGATLYTKANLILCKRDYLRLFGTTGYCAACSKVIPAFEMVMRARNNVYHLECFACQQCNHRFCVGDRFYLCDNKILCEYDYEERMVFANMAYNPSSLAHIRRQVSNLQPGDNLTHNSGGTNPPPPVGNILITSSSTMSTPSTTTSAARPNPITLLALNARGKNIGSGITSNINNGIANNDDASSGYGSPDSDIFDAVQ